jgi:hypothetical protein
MGNSLSDPKDLLIPFIVTNPKGEQITSGLLVTHKSLLLVTHKSFPRL